VNNKQFKICLQWPTPVIQPFTVSEELLTLTVLYHQNLLFRYTYKCHQISGIYYAII